MKRIVNLVFFSILVFNFTVCPMEEFSKVLKKEACSYCGKERANIRRHKKACPLNLDLEKNKKSCLYCKESFSPNSIRRHEKICLQNPDGEKNKKSCSYCKKSFSPNSIRRHEKICHQNPDGEKNKKACSYCKENFSLNYIRKHEKTCLQNPDGEKNKKSCSYCKKSFATSCIRRHEKTCRQNTDREKNKKSCLYCKKKFAHNYIKNHEKTCCKNTGREKNKKSCSYCKKNFSLNYIRKHKKTCRKNLNQEQLNGIKKSNKMKKNPFVFSIAKQVGKKEKKRKNCRYCGNLYIYVRRHEEKCWKNPNREQSKGIKKQSNKKTSHLKYHHFVGPTTQSPSDFFLPEDDYSEGDPGFEFDDIGGGIALEENDNFEENEGNLESWEKEPFYYEEFSEVNINSKWPQQFD